MARENLKVIMTPVGSSGDVHPFLAVGKHLSERGHDVTVITSGPFRDAVKGAGLGYIENQSTEDFDRLTKDPDLWQSRRGLAMLLRKASEAMRGDYERLAALYTPPYTILVGHLLSLATRVFEDRHTAPAVTLNLAPSAFRSVYQLPTFIAGWNLSQLPRGAKCLIWWLIDRWMIDPHVEPQLNRWRAELALAPVRRPLSHWIHGSNLVLGLFPPWFCPKQPDWPASLQLTGFPLYDESAQRPEPAPLEAFLRSAGSPIIFTAGSANQQAQGFFSSAVKALELLRRPGLLLTRYEQQIPNDLPQNVKHFSYIPFSQVLPHSAAMVHHGGIGTCAQGLAAGIPQLIIPMAYDQPDNATHLRRLGVGDWISRRRSTPHRIAARLRSLLRSASVTEACRHCAQQMRHGDANTLTCDLIEQAAGGKCGSHE